MTVGVAYEELQVGWYNYWWGGNPEESLPSYIYVHSIIINDEATWVWNHGEDVNQMFTGAVLENISWHGTELDPERAQ